ncbi:mitochondrial escape protein 2, partial [Oleoguttula sp. CCFEE 6159]
PEVAKRFVITHLDSDPDDLDVEGKPQKLTTSQRRKDLGELDEVISLLGGRLTDLEFLARRIKTGETPKRAVQAIVDQSAFEILKMYLFGVEESGRQWTAEQAWLLIKQLATRETLRYNEVLLSDTYKTAGERVLRALEQAELISIVSSNGRPTLIKPGKPVYMPAFRLLVADHVLQARLDLAILAEQIKIETAGIDKYENELHLIGELPKQPPELAERVRWLLGKVQTAHAKVEADEKESGTLKKVLMSEY